MIEITEYLDYRGFLKDHFEEQRKRFRHFTYRYVAGKTGLDASFYVKVLQKQLHLSNKSIPMMAAFLNLDKRQAQYFALLVRFNKAKLPEESKLYFEKLMRMKGPAATVLEPGQYEFFQKWYYAAIKESLSILRFKDEYADLARSMIPPINEAQARKAVQLLAGLGLIRKEADGTHVLTDRNITTGESWKTMAPIAIRGFQKEFLRRAEDALDIIPAADRDISTLTFSISGRMVAAMRERIAEMRKELIMMANGDPEPDRVFQLNVQLFPLMAAPARKAAP